MAGNVNNVVIPIPTRPVNLYRVVYVNFFDHENYAMDRYYPISQNLPGIESAEMNKASQERVTKTTLGM